MRTPVDMLIVPADRGALYRVNLGSVVELLACVQRSLRIAKSQTRAINASRIVMPKGIVQQMIDERRRNAGRARSEMMKAIVLLKKGVFIT